MVMAVVTVAVAVGVLGGDLRRFGGPAGLGVLVGDRQVTTDEAVVKGGSDQGADDRSDDGHPEVQLAVLIPHRPAVARQEGHEAWPEVAGRVDGVSGVAAPRHADGHDDQPHDERGHVGARRAVADVGDRQDQQHQNRRADDLVAESATGLHQALSAVGRQGGEDALRLDGVVRVELGNGLGVVPAHDQGGQEGA
jgi:hypothetical protein